MENDLPKSGDIISEREEKKMAYDPDSIFKNKEVSYFGNAGDIKIQFNEFTKATGKKKWVNSAIVVLIFLIVEAVIIANYPPARSFVVSFFSLKR